MSGLKLSAAIRMGAAIKPQAKNGWSGTRTTLRRKAGFPWFEIMTQETSCAMKAAYDAHGGGFHRRTLPKGTAITPFRGNARVLTAPEVVDEWDTPEEFYAVFYVEAPCPSCALIQLVKNGIPHLNDVHKWSREQIADWVESLEAKTESILAPETVTAD